MNSLIFKTKINNNLVNIVRSYLTISKVKVNRNRKLMNYNMSILHFSYSENIITTVNRLIHIYKNLRCSYCINCDSPADYYPNYSSKNFKIIFNKETICDKCFDVYISKKRIIESLKTDFKS